MQLEEIIPVGRTFTLDSTKKTYNIRLPNLADRVYFRHVAGSDQGLQEALKTMNWDVVSKVVFRLLEEKEDFLGQTVEQVNDSGIKEKVFVSGPEKLLTMISSSKEILQIITSLSRAFLDADPVVKEMAEEELASQKKSTQKLTGQKSSTL